MRRAVRVVGVFVMFAAKPRRSATGAEPGLERFFAAMGRLEVRVSLHPLVVLLVGGICAVFVQWVTRGDPRLWDWVWISGMIAVSLGLPPAFRLRTSADRTIDRLADRGILTGSTSNLVNETHRKGDLIGRYVGPLLAALVLLGFLTRAVVPPAAPTGPGFTDLGNNAAEILVGSLAAFFVGRAAGEVMATATLGRRIESGPWTLHIQPGHIDGAAGMKPVGDLYFRQAMIVAIPVVWLIVVLCLKVLAVAGAEGWAAAIQIVGGGHGWGPWYFFLLVVALGLEIAAFIAPMVSFHRIMVLQKQKLEVVADQRSELLHRLVEELPSIDDDAARQSMEGRISGIRELNMRIEEMPTWPVDAAVRRRFTIRNAVLLIPVVANAIGIATESDNWSTLGDIFG